MNNLSDSKKEHADPNNSSSNSSIRSGVNWGSFIDTDGTPTTAVSSNYVSATSSISLLKPTLTSSIHESFQQRRLSSNSSIPTSFPQNDLNGSSSSPLFSSSTPQISSKSNWLLNPPATTLSPEFPSGVPSTAGINSEFPHSFSSLTPPLLKNTNTVAPPTIQDHAKISELASKGLPNNHSLTHTRSRSDPDTIGKPSKLNKIMNSLYKKEVHSSLAAGEASIVVPQPTHNPSSAYESLSSVARAASSSPTGNKQTPETKPAPPESKKDQPSSSSMTDKLIDKLVAAALPTSSLNMADAERRAVYMKSNPAFSIPVMGRNFSNMTARTGVVFEAYYSFLRIATWECPMHTISILGIYTIVVLNPRLIPTLPFIFILAYLMVPSYVYRHPPDPTIIDPDPTIESKVLSVISPADYSLSNPTYNSPSSSSSNSARANYITHNSTATDVLIHHNPSPVIAPGPPLGEPIIPKPVPEISREFFMNMVDTQNAMVLYIDGFDSVLAFLKRFAFFDGDETTSCLIYIFLMAGALFAYIFTPLIIKYTPWKVVFLIIGWGASIRMHPGYDHNKVIKPIKKKFKKTKEQGKKTFKKVVSKIKNRRSDSGSSFSLDNIFSGHSSKHDLPLEDSEENLNNIEIKHPEDVDELTEDIIDYSDLDEDSESEIEEEPQEKVPEELGNETSKLVPKIDDGPKSVFEQTLLFGRHFVVKAQEIFLSSNLRFLFLNPISNEFWTAIHTTAYAEFNSKEPHEQRTVEVFEIQFARGRAPISEVKTGKKLEASKKRIRYSNWEPSLYSTQSCLPRVKISTVYTSNSQQVQLQQILATLSSSSSNDSDKAEEADENEDKLEAEAAAASAAAAAASDPFILPGLVQLNEVLAPPFWQFIPGTQWKLDMKAVEWVSARGIKFEKLEADRTSEGEESEIIYSEDGTIAVDDDEKWVYDQIPITLETDGLPNNKNAKKDSKKKPSKKSDSSADGKPTGGSNEEESSKYFSWLTESSSQVASTPKASNECNVIWLRRRRWIRSCTRHTVVRDAAK
ncbi:uncharacterized protein SAPINGB_P004814 [Magnusiomyces paraingens]|uniref:TECPR1-like DysF domain-containing protein n=1 Tax=Magnusiomyces paraingens TaxID=2606893 RepID=A0A5E8BXA7_9ASCO|nr:uncharacterized protein SAPINGB_P004814 [Saprochaete ingens]VVT56103.1 unnamed protein product [Saprochaete ingens]